MSRDGHEFEQAPGVGDGQGGLACCSSWGHKDPDRSELLNWTRATGKSLKTGLLMSQMILNFFCYCYLFIINYPKGTIEKSCMGS